MARVPRMGETTAVVMKRLPGRIWKGKRAGEPRVRRFGKRRIRRIVSFMDDIGGVRALVSVGLAVVDGEKVVVRRIDAGPWWVIRPPAEEE